MVHECPEQPSFSGPETLAMKVMMRKLANYCREDLMGAIMYAGGAHILGVEDDGKSIVALARKLELTEDERKLAKEAGVSEL